jgi:hypothetical protein
MQLSWLRKAHSARAGSHGAGGARPNKHVGAELGISEITVKAHRGQVMGKMKADSLAGLVRMAAALDLPVADTDTKVSTNTIVQLIRSHARAISRACMEARACLLRQSWRLS